MLMAEQRGLAVADDFFVRRNQSPERKQQDLTGTYSVRQATRRKKTNSKTFIAIGLFLMGLIFYNLFIQAMVIQHDYEIRQFQSKIAHLKREIVATRMEMASLESFDRIQAIAENKLGMKVANSTDYQCIAAVPEVKNQQMHSYTKQTEPTDKETIWNQISSWIGNAGSAMAQNQ